MDIFNLIKLPTVPETDLLLKLRDRAYDKDIITILFVSSCFQVSGVFQKARNDMNRILSCLTLAFFLIFSANSSFTAAADKTYSDIEIITDAEDLAGTIELAGAKLTLGKSGELNSYLFESGGNSLYNEIGAQGPNRSNYIMSGRAADGTDAGVFPWLSRPNAEPWSSVIYWDGNRGDQFSYVWSGYFTPEYSDNYSIWCRGDDIASFWIDLNQNGVFQPGEEVAIAFWDKGEGGTVYLEAGKMYAVTMLMAEMNGGDLYDFRIARGGVTLNQDTGQEYRIFASENKNGGTWSTPVKDAWKLASSTFQVTEDSSLEFLSSGITLGTVELQNNKTLTFTKHDKLTIGTLKGNGTLASLSDNALILAGFDLSIDAALNGDSRIYLDGLFTLQDGFLLNVNFDPSGLALTTDKAYPILSFTGGGLVDVSNSPLSSGALSGITLTGIPGMNFTNAELFYDGTDVILRGMTYSAPNAPGYFTVADGNWHANNSWDEFTPPIASEIAKIWHNITVTADGAALMVNIWDGSLTINPDKTLTVTGGVVNVAALTVYGTLDGGGFLENTNTTTIASGGTVSAGAVTNNGTMEVDGTLNAVYLESSGTLDIRGTVNITPEAGNDSYSSGQTTISGGTVNIGGDHKFSVTDGKLTVNGGAFHFSNSGSNFHVQNSAELALANGTLNAYAAHLEDSSTTTLSGGTMNTANTLNVEHNATLTVNNATLNHGGGGESFVVGDNAQLNLSNGTINLTNGGGVLAIRDSAAASFTGGTLNAPTVLLENGSMTLSGSTLNVGTLRKNAGTFTFTGGTLNAGTINFNDTFVQQGGRLSPGGDNRGTTTISGAYDFTGGTIRLDINPNAVTVDLLGSILSGGSHSDLIIVDGYTNFNAVPNWDLNFQSAANTGRFLTRDAPYVLTYQLVALNGGWNEGATLPLGDLLSGTNSGADWVLRSTADGIYLDYSFFGTSTGEYIWAVTDGRLNVDSCWESGAAPGPGNVGIIRNRTNNTIQNNEGGNNVIVNFELQVTGSGTNVNAGDGDGDFSVGRADGAGKVVVSDGATFTTGAGKEMRLAHDGNGDILVQTGGRFIVDRNASDSGNLIGHGANTGTVTVESGGLFEVTKTRTSFAWHGGSTGKLIVDGAGSTASLRDTITRNGLGIIEVTNGGEVTINGWFHTNEVNNDEGHPNPTANIILGSGGKMTVTGMMETNYSCDSATVTTINLSGNDTVLSVGNEFRTNRSVNSTTTMTLSDGARMSVNGHFYPLWGGDNRTMGANAFVLDMSGSSRLEVTNGDIKIGHSVNSSSLGDGEYMGRLIFAGNSVTEGDGEAWLAYDAKTHITIKDNARVTSKYYNSGIGCGGNAAGSVLDMEGGTLSVMTMNAWNNTTMNQTGGTVNVANRFQINGGDNPCTLNLSGGTVNIADAFSPQGNFNFTGGTLSAARITEGFEQKGGFLSPNTVTPLGFELNTENNNASRFSGNFDIAPIGSTTVNGYYTLTAGTIALDVDLSAITLANANQQVATSYNDLLTVTGNAAFTSGTLALNLMNAGSMNTSGLTDGDTFTYQLMALNSWNPADFGNLTVTGLASGWSVNPQDNGVYLTYTYAEGSTTEYIWNENHSGNFLDGTSWSDSVAPSAGVAAKITGGTNRITNTADIDGFSLAVSGGNTTADHDVNIRNGGSLSLTDGTLNIAGHLTGSTGDFSFTGGTLNARHVDFALVQNGGDSILSPGGRGVFGTTDIVGDYVLTNGKVELDVNLSSFAWDSTAGKYVGQQKDLINVAGDVTFTADSILDLLLQGSLPSSGSIPEGETWEFTYQLMALTGEWFGLASLESKLGDIWSDLQFINNEGLYLNYSITGTGTQGGDVPEPAAWTLMLVGLGGLYVWRRKSRNNG